MCEGEGEGQKERRKDEDERKNEERHWVACKRLDLNVSGEITC